MATQGRSSHFSSVRRDGGLGHVRVQHDAVLEVDRGNPLTAGLDDVLGAIGQREIAVRADPADVPGAQPAVVEGVAARGLTGRGVVLNTAASPVVDERRPFAS